MSASSWSLAATPSSWTRAVRRSSESSSGVLIMRQSPLSSEAGTGSSVLAAEPDRGQRRQGQLDRAWLAVPGHLLTREAAVVAHVAAPVEAAVRVHDLRIVSGARHPDAITAADHRGEVVGAQDDLAGVPAKPAERDDALLGVVAVH